ncbi:fungal hydrophobin [Hygrophoropsis aurantiaca]|uniref:Fungal hydrophobin n=1 Tax=Hygrophoropsis aurantiaca TaxID=72124 RepID=A0ACB8AFH5_9AGAM|nr:fungal hydrophobin [Hygrophoropsis aurantiaca]
MIASHVLALLPFALAALAGDSTTQCNTGSAKCCNSTQTVQQAQQSGLLKSCGLSVADLDAAGITGLVGVDCSPLSVVGVGSGCQANQEPVCCSDNTFNGIANVGCSPINVNL